MTAAVRAAGYRTPCSTASRSAPGRLNAVLGARRR